MQNVRILYQISASVKQTFLVLNQYLTVAYHTTISNFDILDLNLKFDFLLFFWYFHLFKI